MNVTLTNILQWAGRHVIWSLTLILILASTVTMNNSMLSLFLLTALQKFEDICHVSTTIFFFPSEGMSLVFPYLSLSLFHLYIMQHFHWFMVLDSFHPILSFFVNSSFKMWHSQHSRTLVENLTGAKHKDSMSAFFSLHFC